MYYRDASNAEAKHALAVAKAFIATHPQEAVTFRLAGGLVGILAAVQEEVEHSYRYNLLLVLLAVFLLSYLTYRSVVGALIVMLPSIIAQPLTEAFMYVEGIDMNISSLPVAAVGIGIGIDYGYYVLSRIIEEYAVCRDFDEANRRTLLTTGKAVCLYRDNTGCQRDFVGSFPHEVSGRNGPITGADSPVSCGRSVSVYSGSSLTAQAPFCGHLGQRIAEEAAPIPGQPPA